MTFWIIPESDREGRALCQIWLQGGIHNTQYDSHRQEKLVQARSPRDLRPSIFLKKEGLRRLTRFPETN